MIQQITRYFLNNRLMPALFIAAAVLWGLATAPFAWAPSWLPRDPISVDAIPDIGENQQIVTAEWMGRSPQDVQDQIAYPLSAALTGIAQVRPVRTTAMFGMCFIYILFEDGADFYDSRSRIVEKLNALPEGTLPAGVRPQLGPDATGLGQIFWYTLQARDTATGAPLSAWEPQELRRLQDFYIKPALSAVAGISEVSSIGGYATEYQIDADPAKMRNYGISLMEVMKAVRESNQDVGAETMEINNVEYMVRGIGLIKSAEELEQSVVAIRNGSPLRIADIARVSLGPAPRRGGLDIGGKESVGGVVVARYGENPLQVIERVKARIAQLSPNLPTKKIGNTQSAQITIEPFYDRTQLINETIGTLDSALSHEMLICIIVVIVLLSNIRASAIIASLLPLAVLITFIAMKLAGIQANIVALSGIAIAIGVMVDVGIIYMENVSHINEEESEGNKISLNDLIAKAISQVSPAVITALATTIISFLPVFALQSAEGKLFHPLALTKTIAIASSFLVGILVLPSAAFWLFKENPRLQQRKRLLYIALIIGGLAAALLSDRIAGISLAMLGGVMLWAQRIPKIGTLVQRFAPQGFALAYSLYFLTVHWLPLNTASGTPLNLLFVFGIVGLTLGLLAAMIHWYAPIMRWSLDHKRSFLAIPALTLAWGLFAWLGTERILSPLGWPWGAQAETPWVKRATNWFPGMGREFMPSLNEGSFLLMPSSMPHAGIGMSQAYVSALDKRMQQIPEVEIAVGKWGRTQSALDPAPVQMFENIINYRPEYILDEAGHRMRFKTGKNDAYLLRNGQGYNPETESFRLIPHDSLIPDANGEYFRQWRPHIKTSNDIWEEISRKSQFPGLTSAPRLQPIETRLVMLSTGMRAPMGLKIYAPDIQAMDEAGFLLEQELKKIPSINASAVFYERATGAPTVEVRYRRQDLARYGISMAQAQEVLETAAGGMSLSTAINGRERTPIRLRYPRELRDNPESLGRITLMAGNGAAIPLSLVADIVYRKPPQMIRGEDSFLCGYVIFDKQGTASEVEVVQEAQAGIEAALSSGTLQLPHGTSFAFAGSYEQQQRASQRLALLIPLSLALIFLLLYWRFKTATASLIHFSGVFVALAGGFIMLWLYAQPWFMNFEIDGNNLRDVFQMKAYNMSVAVWVGFIALFGIATNDGVIMGTYIHSVFEERRPKTKAEVRAAVLEAGLKRVRPAMMTTAVAVIALLPVLTSTGKGADIMVPMAIPTFGGMALQSMTVFVVPIFQAIWRERRLK